MRNLLAVLAAALMIAGPAAALGGPPQDDIANHPALYGLCTAYFSGNGGENGNKNSAPPFAALEAAADAAGDEDGEATSDEVADFCDGVRPSNGTGNGKQDDSKAPNPTGRG
jgi:hypothetical protein